MRIANSREAYRHTDISATLRAAARTARRGFWYLIYTGIAKHLPCSYGIMGGRLAKRIRYGCCRRMFVRCGANVNVERGATFGSGRRISIGHDSDLGINCRIYGTVHIGDHSFMGPDVVIWTTNHRFDRTDIPMMYQGSTPEQPVTIGNDVWIGTRAILLPGVHIGSHSVVGAGAVVAKDIPEWSVVAGNPARVIRYRKPECDPAYHGSGLRPWQSKPAFFEEMPHTETSLPEA